jgi:hypothetical protein
VTEPEAPPRRRPEQGRPTLLTDELADRIVQVVNAGNYLKTAAQFAGVGQSTLMSWLARGRAAAAQVDLHDPAVLECPNCGDDRTAEVRAVEEHNAQTDVPEGWAHRILGPCPNCRSGRPPTPWTLPETEVRFLDFLERVTQAETVAEVSAVTHWRRAFSDDWRAARDYLARKRPDQWAAKTTVALSSEEAEHRIEAATLQALTALGVDTAGLGLDDLDEDGWDGVEVEEP